MSSWQFHALGLQADRFQRQQHPMKAAKSCNYNSVQVTAKLTSPVDTLSNDRIGVRHEAAAHMVKQHEGNAV